MKVAYIASLALMCSAAVAVSDDVQVQFGEADVSFVIDFVDVGNPGNADDDVPVWTGVERFHLGAVDYEFSISKFEVSRGQVKHALSTGGLEVPARLADMQRFGGARDEQPATGMDWVETLSFANWLNRQHGYPLAYDLGSSGSNIIWEEGDPGFDPQNIWRNSCAVFAIPTSDEWHKAAYYDPNKNDGAGGYWRYPTGSDTPPLSVAEGQDAGTAVWGLSLEDGPADVTTAGGLSPYGVMAMGANATEWQESTFHPDHPLQSDKAVRGSSGTVRTIR